MVAPAAGYPAPQTQPEGVGVSTGRAGCFVFDGNRVTMTDREGKPYRSLDHLVGKREQIMRDSKPKCLGCLEVDDEIEFGRLFHRNVAGLCAA